MHFLKNHDFTFFQIFFDYKKIWFLVFTPFPLQKKFKNMIHSTKRILKVTNFQMTTHILYPHIFSTYNFRYFYTILSIWHKNFELFTSRKHDFLHVVEKKSAKSKIDGEATKETTFEKS